MSEFLHHWLWTDLWSPIWPNLAASGITGTTIAKVLHVVLRRHITAEAERTRGHCDGCICGGGAQ